MKTYHDSTIKLDDVGTTAPTEFRIWKFGPNDTDHGPVTFNEQSAQLLMESQKKRGNLYSIDYDHLSLAKDRPATAGQASGWHALDLRYDVNEKPELWATSVEWCAEAKEGIEAKPPKWRFFSPAYVTDENGVIIDYVNLALCVNPATWNAPMLATRSHWDTQDTKMDKQAILAMLQALVATEGLPEDVKAKLGEVLSALSAGAPEEAPASQSEPVMAAVEEPAPATPATAPVEEKQKMDNLDMAKRLAQAEAQIQRMELEKLYNDNVGKKITPSLKGWFLGLDMDTATAFLSSAPAMDTSVKTIQRSDTVGVKADVKVEGPDASKIDKVLGIRPRSEQLGMDNKVSQTGTYEVRLATPSEIRARKNASK